MSNHAHGGGSPAGRNLRDDGVSFGRGSDVTWTAATGAAGTGLENGRELKEHPAWISLDQGVETAQTKGHGQPHLYRKE